MATDTNDPSPAGCGLGVGQADRITANQRTGHVTGNLPFLKYNVYCLDGLIQNSFSSHFEFGSTVELNTKRSEKYQNQTCDSVHTA